MRVAYVGADSIRHVVDSTDRDIVLRARAFDRADKLDSARVLYEEAAKRLDALSDWLYLRAAGVTTDGSAREKYYRKLDTDIAKTRRKPTEAVALERSRDFPAAVTAYKDAGMRLDALRLQASPPADSASVLAARHGMLGYLEDASERDSARAGVALFDKFFPTPTPIEQLTLGRAAYKGSLAARAVTGYTAAFRARLGTPRDHFDAGLMLARLNRDAEAAQQFAVVSAPSSLVAAARYQRARALIALRRGSDARTALRAITTAFPTDTSSANALMLLADLATDESRDADARSTLLTVVNRFPHTRQASAALLRAGLIAFTARDYVAASRELDSLAELYPSSEEALAARYWAGRALDLRGNKAAARAHWQAVMSNEASSYYSVLSARRLGVSLLKDSSRNDNYPKISDITDATQRANMLEDLGMDAEAKFEYDYLYDRATKDNNRLVATAHALAGSDQSSRAMTLGRKAVSEIGTSAQNYRLLYPVAEKAQLAASSKANGLDPALVAGLIKQESSFNPRATSPVGARGLMQVMPDVGRALARSRGIKDLPAERLYDPVVNIQLGTMHLAGLFRGKREVAHILAAYNAGEARLARWLRKPGANDPELFTERIPYTETRDYVRAVIRNRAFYRFLYDWQ